MLQRVSSVYLLENEHILKSEDVRFLKRTIGRMLDSYICCEMPYSKSIYHDAGFMVSGCVFDIVNELELAEYYNAAEEVARFRIDESPEREALGSNGCSKVYPIGEAIDDVIIVRDAVSVRDNSDGSAVYDIVVDNAIVFKLRSCFLACYRDWILDEFMYIVRSDDYRAAIRSVRMIEEEFSDGEAGKHSAKCERIEISLKHWKPEG